MSVCDYQPEPSVKELQYAFLRNEIFEDDFLCIVARLPEHSPKLAVELRDEVKAVLIDLLPERGAKHPMTRDFLKRVELGKKLFE